MSREDIQLTISREDQVNNFERGFLLESPAETRRTNKVRVALLITIITLAVYMSVSGTWFVYSEKHTKQVLLENKCEPKELEAYQSKVSDDYNRVITREQWHAKPTNGTFEKSRIAFEVIIGETNTKECTDIQSCTYRVQLLQELDMQYRFKDIIYNFLVGGDGAVYEGIGWNNIGYHTEGHNNYSIGIWFIGKFQTENQLSAAKLLILDGIEKNKIKGNYYLMGHRDLVFGSESPGEALHARIKKWPHYCGVYCRKQRSDSN